MNSSKTITLKKTARYAGILYLLVAIIAPFGLMYIPSKIIVWDNASATVNNMLDKEFLFRIGIAIRMSVQVLMLLVVWYLYRLLKEVNEHQAKLMIIFYFVAVPVGFLVNVFNVTGLVLSLEDILQSFSPEQVNDMTLLFLSIGSYDTQLVQLFWGLWLLPFGLLVYNSKFIPRIFGVLIFINGIAYVVLCMTFVLFPEYKSLVYKFSLPFFFIGEIPIIFWLIIKGVKTQE
jgi:hypothetical protein